jgi:hypothetical protein
MKNRSKIMVALLFVGLTPACLIVPSETKRAVGSNVAVGTTRMAEWDTLTPGQRKQAYWQLVRAFCDLDYQFNGIAIPQEYLTNPHYSVAPVATSATVAPAATTGAK